MRLQPLFQYQSPFASRLRIWLFSLLATLGFLAVATLARAQTNGTWNADASDNWSTASRWTGNTVANGAGAIADFSLFNITATRTITLDTSRTIGTLRLGDTNTTNTYTIARTGSNTLTFDSGVVGTNAVLSISATSNGDTISAPIILNSSLDLTNNAVSGKTVTLSGGISASATVRTLTIGGTGAATTNISGALSGTVALVMDNATGTTNLVGNTHTGGTTLTSGTLVLNSSTSLGTATVGTTSFTINGGTFNNLSAGTLTFGNSYTYAWNGNFTFTGSSSIALGTGTITLGNNVQVSVGNNTLNAGGIISGAFALSKAGSGTLTLGGANTFSGGMTLSAGTLNLGNASALGTGTFTIAGGTLNTAGTNLTLSTNNTQLWNGNFTFTGSNSLNLGTGAVTLSANRQVTVTANTLTVGGGIGEASSGLTFTKAGVGTLVLNGNNTYTGATTISGGVLIFGTGAGTVTTAGNFTISANAALGAQGSTGFTNATEWLASNRIVASSAGALALTSSDNANLNFSAFSSLFLGAIGNVTYSGILTPHATGGYRLGGGGGTLTVSSVLALNSAANITSNLTVNGNVTLTGSNHYKGTTTVTGGILTFSGLDQLGLNSSITLSGGSIQWAAGNVTDLTSRDVTLGSSGGTFVTNGNSITFHRAILGTGALVKSGAGMLTLETARASAGATVIANGSLRLGVNEALGSGGALTLGSGTTAGYLDLDGHNQTVSSLTVDTNSSAVTNRIHITQGNTLTTNGNVTFGNAASAAVSASAVTGGGTWNVTSNSTTATFAVGGSTNGSNSTSAIVDLSGLRELNVQYTGVGSAFRVGDNSVATGSVGSTLKLAAISTIRATQISVGGDTGANITQTLTLGSVSNTLYADVFEIGAFDGNTSPRANGLVNFTTGTGTLVVRAQNGTGRASFNVVSTSSNTGNTVAGTVDLTGHSADLLLSNLTIASRDNNNAGSGATGLFTFDTGKIDAATILVGIKGSNSHSGEIRGTLNINGGDVDATSLTMARNANTATVGPATGILNMTRGTLDISGVATVSRHETIGGTATGTLTISGDAAVTFGSLVVSQNVVAAGSVTSSATGTVNVRGGSLTVGSGGIVLSSTAFAGATSVGSLNISGGRVTVGGDIVDSGGAGTSTSTIALTGGILDLNGNDITGVDTLTWTAGTLQNVATINGAGGFTKATNGVLTLAGTNTWTGNTTINAGVVVFGSDASLGGGTSQLVFGGGALRWASGTATDISATRTITFNAGGARFDTNGNNVTLNAGVGNNGAGGLVKSGAGDLVLKGSSSYTGATTFRGGVLRLDFTGSNTGASRLSSSSTLTAAGGALQVLGTDVVGQTTVQTVNGLAITQGHSSLNVTGTSGIGATLNLGAISRSLGATIAFSTSNGTLTTTTANAFFAGGSQTILGGYATFGTTTWAVSGSGSTAGNITGLDDSAYSATFTAGTDVSATSGASGSGALTINSLRYNAAGSATTTLTGALNIATGGILVTSNTGAVSITGGSLTSGNGQDLIIHQNNAASSLTISSVISGSTGLVKSGAGTLILSGTNTYTGTTYINGGKLSIAAEGAVGAGGSLGLSPSTLDADNIVINGGTLTAGAAVTLLANRGVQIGENGGTLRHEGQRLWINGVVADVAGQSGVLVIEGDSSPNGDVVLSGANTYSGGTLLSANSRVVVVSNNAFGTGVVTFAGGMLRTGTSAAVTMANQIVFAADANFYFAAGQQALTMTGNATLSGGNRTLTLGSSGGNVVTVTLSGNMGEDGTSRSFTKDGGGNLIVTGFNTYSGGTIINGGVLQIGVAAGSTHTNADAALGAVPSSAATNVTFSGTSTLQLVANALTILNANRNIAINSGVTATFDANGGSLTILGQISGAGALKTGTAGTVTLANATNSYAGGTTIAGGTVIANGDGAFGSATGSIAFTGSATLQALDTITMGSGRNITLASGATATFNPLGNTITINGQVSGAGNLAISSTSGVVVLAGANNFSGTTIIGDVATPGTAILRLMQANALASTSGITIGRNATDDSSRLQLAFTGTSTFDRNITTTSRNTSVAHVQNVSGSTTLTGTFTTAGAGAQTAFQSDAGELNLQFSSTTNSVSTIALQGEGDGRVSSNLYSAAATGGLVKNGPGTWRIEAAQTYSGATTVNQGVLLANNATGSATGTGAVTVSGGVLGGTGIVQGNTLVNGAGSLRPGDSAVNGGIGRLRFSGNVELSGSTVATDRLLLQIGSSGGADVNDADGFYTALAANNFASYLSGKAADYEALNSGNHDQIIVAGTLTIEGNSVVRLGREDGSSAYSSSPAFGDVFDLLDFTTLLLDGYTFGTAQRAGGLVGGLDLPTLSAGLFYDTSLFASNGIIVVVPEPSRALLVLLAVGAWMMRRRKSF